MMKLLFICDNFPPIVDGVGDYTSHLSNQLAQRGHAVSVICSRKEEIVQYAGTQTAVRVLPAVTRWNRQAIAPIMALAGEIQPDWVILQYVPYSYDYYGIPFWLRSLASGLKARGYKLAVTCHEIFIDLELAKAKYWPVAISQRLIAFSLVGLADKVVVSIERTQRQLGRYRRKVTRIPIGSNIVPVPVTDDQVQALRRELAPQGEFLFVSFGIRDQEAALRILADLTKAGHPARLVLLGKLRPEQRQATEQLIATLGLEGRVTLTGYLDNDQLFRVLRSGDAFMLLEEKRGGLTTKSGSLAAAYAAAVGLAATVSSGDRPCFLRAATFSRTATSMSR